jgi:HlyD family secretion protein
MDAVNVWRKRIVVAAIVVVVLAGLAFILRSKPVPVETVRAQRGVLQVTVDEEGETRVRERFLVAAPVSGRLQRITLDPGDVVQRGVVVARMNPLPLDPRSLIGAQARLEAAEAAKREADAGVERARAGAEQAERDASRAATLAEQGTIATEQRERAEVEATARQKGLEAAEFAARAAAYNVDAARAALLAPGRTSTVSVCAEESEACIDLHAPIGGSVLRVFEESERVVAVGAPLVEIGDPKELEVVIDLLSTDAVNVAPGDPILFEDWGGGETLHGRVRLVEPSGFTKISALGVEEQRVNVIADFVDVPERLGDAFRLEARIVTWEGSDVLSVPSSALFRRNGQWAVFTVDEGSRARVTGVEVGRANSFEVEIHDGLQQGAVVIVHPSDLIEEGTRVEQTSNG